MAAEAVPRLDTAAQPIGRPQVDEHAGLGRPADLVQAGELTLVAALVAETRHRAEVEIAARQQRE